MKENKFGLLLCKSRKIKGWKQSELADKLHVSDKAVSRWETGSNLPDIDMMCKISKIFNIPLNELLKYKINNDENDGVSTLAIELENKNIKIKRKIRNIIIVFLSTILFLCLLLFFVANYNKFKIYDVGITGDNFYSTKGVYINTNVQDILYLGNISLIEEPKNYTFSANIYTYVDNKEIILFHFDNIYRNLEFDLYKSRYKIEKLEDYFNKLYIRVTGINCKNESISFDAKIHFSSRFTNSKFFYNPEHKGKDYKKTKSDAEIKLSLDEQGFKESEGCTYVDRSKKFLYLLNGRQLIYKNEDKKANIIYKYVYFYETKELNVLIINKSTKVNTVIESYNYNIYTKKIDCFGGQCLNYQEILGFLDKYIKAF